MLEIYAGLSKSKAPTAIMSKAISLFMGKPYSHCFFRIFDHELGVCYIFEARKKGLFFCSSKVFDENNYTYKLYHLPDLDYTKQKELKRDLFKLCGTEYALAQNIGLAISDIFNLDKNYFTKGMNCSEVLARVLNKYWQVSFKESYDLIDPEDVDDALKLYSKGAK